MRKCVNAYTCKCVNAQTRKRINAENKRQEEKSYDLQVSIDGLAWLKELTEAARDDYSTFDILKAYYQDEEEDMYWGQAQLEMIECIGKQNWLLRQM